MVVVRTVVWKPDRAINDFWDLTRLWIRSWRKHLPEARLIVITPSVKDLPDIKPDEIIRQDPESFMWQLGRAAKKRSGSMNWPKWPKWEPLRVHLDDWEIHVDHDVIPIKRPKTIIDWWSRRSRQILVYCRPIDSNLPCKKNRFGKFNRHPGIRTTRVFGLVSGFLGMPPNWSLDSQHLNNFEFKSLLERRSESGWIARNIWYEHVRRNVEFTPNEFFVQCAGGRLRSDPIDKEDLDAAEIVHVRHIARARTILEMIGEST